MRRIPFPLVVAACIGSLATLTGADTLGLRDGSTLSGISANHQRLVAGAIPDSVAILVTTAGPDSGSVRRFAAREVSYLIVDENGRKTLLDFSGHLPRSVRTDADAHTAKRIARSGTSITREYSSPSQSSPSTLRASGTAITILGLAATIVGIAVKLGPARIKINSDYITAEEKSYNGINFAMIGGGSVATIAGLVVVGRSSRSEAKMSARHTEPEFRVALLTRSF